MVRMVIADFESSNSNKGLTELFYPIHDTASLRAIEKEGYTHLEVQIETYNPDYFMVTITPGSVYYAGKERIPYEIIKTSSFTYCIMEFGSTPSAAVEDRLKEKNLLVEFDPAKRMLLSCHVMVYYYFICRDNVNNFQKTVSLDMLPEEKMPKDFCGN